MSSLSISTTKFYSLASIYWRIKTLLQKYVLFNHYESFSINSQNVPQNYQRNDLSPIDFSHQFFRNHILRLGALLRYYAGLTDDYFDNLAKLIIIKSLCIMHTLPLLGIITEDQLAKLEKNNNMQLYRSQKITYQLIDIFSYADSLNLDFLISFILVFFVTFFSFKHWQNLIKLDLKVAASIYHQNIVPQFMQLLSLFDNQKINQIKQRKNFIIQVKCIAEKCLNTKNQYLSVENIILFLELFFNFVFHFVLGGFQDRIQSPTFLKKFQNMKGNIKMRQRDEVKMSKDLMIQLRRNKEQQ
ncbi:unnamed protein product (macronuclear) [Paramecium tetraurelia]|uniref:Transmembrane protein n=1 Tax=Paramecium tetraurelia TaxID=5888 RepID=A0BUJ0_PARTE|nr:uncharacterized protein GSPATT00005452001 [Paramecium tetraurelia]CAK62207.1 unnamed protein product [Paramecium tetraurelia]|eukprot:XP_001429605.1 hypothetical protein (macronuclear) [Paramecium tetraurelia strain d4-2]